MIVIFHIIYVMTSSLITMISNSIFTAPHPLSKSSKKEQEYESLQSSDAHKCSTNADIVEASVVEAVEVRKSYVQDMEPIVGLQFIPPVYAQRYMAVQDILADQRWNGSVKKVTDFGCAEFGFFTYLKNVPGVEEIVTVDIDGELLGRCSCRVAPLTTDYLSNRESPLRVQVFVGSIAKPDPCLLGTDAVVCIEIIEHLWPQEVEAVPHTVFGFIKPQVAIFTTPNSDFNVLFTNFSGFRHLDHKFEWSREQFQCWASNIVTRYPDYEVSFQGIGAGPPGTEVYGHCSQMAVFVKHTPSCTDESLQEEVANDEFIKICEYVYPYRVDHRTIEEKILHEAEYNIRCLSLNEEFCNDDGITEVPLCMLMPSLEKWCTLEDSLVSILESNGWKMSHRDPNNPSVIYPYFCDDSDSCHSAVHDEPGTWRTQAEEEEYRTNESDWDDETEDNSFIYPVEFLEVKQQAIEDPHFDSNCETCSSVMEKNKLSQRDKILPNIETKLEKKKIESHFNSPSKMIVPENTSISQSSVERTYTVANGLHDATRSDGRLTGLDMPSSSVSCHSHKSEVSNDSSANLSYELFTPTSCQQQLSDSLLVNYSMCERDVDSSSDDCNYVDNSRSEQDMDQDDSSSDDSHDNPMPRVQHHRNHFPFGLNEVMVENGDVANNNRDGEGNNAVALLQEVLVIDLDPDDELEDRPEEDEDFENDNNDPMPDPMDGFPNWLLNLIDIINHGGPEMNGAGEPNGHV